MVYYDCHCSSAFCNKLRSHRQCDCDAITLRPLKRTITKKSQRSQEGFIEVVMRSPIGRRTKSIASNLLSMHKRLAVTDFVAQSFHWSLRGREVAFVSS